MLKASSFTFAGYKVDKRRSVVTFTYRVTFNFGVTKTFRDRLSLQDVLPEHWEHVPANILASTLQSLLLMLGINYWAVFPTKNIVIQGFALTKEQAEFWNSLYLNGMVEFFYNMKIDFRELIAFPYDELYIQPRPEKYSRSNRILLLNGAGKDSILSAEMLKAAQIPFDFFSFAPTPAHKRIAALVGAKTITVERRRDPLLEIYMSLFGISYDYPSVSTFTFIATLLSELLGYSEIVFSNEKSADFGNTTYLGVPVNHQWCKSSEAEALVNAYIKDYITPNISSRSLLREFNELEIVQKFIQYPQYLRQVTSCNSYFWLPRYIQWVLPHAYWCKQCPKCVFLFACYAAYLPKSDVVTMFGGDLYADKRLLPLFKRILGLEGFKPLDCVGEPEEMIQAMQQASQRGEYTNETAMNLFEKHFNRS